MTTTRFETLLLLIGLRRRCVVSGLGPQPGLLRRGGGGELLGTSDLGLGLGTGDLGLLALLDRGQLDVLDLLEELLAAGRRQRLAVVALDDPVLQEARHLPVTRVVRLPQRRVAPSEIQAGDTSCRVLGSVTPDTYYGIYGVVSHYLQHSHRFL